MKSSKKEALSRRQFLRCAATAASGVMIVPRHVLGGAGYTAPSDRLNLAGIGVGGRGRGILRGASGLSEDGTTRENVVALADVDLRQAAETFADYPQAKRYTDFRIMLDEMGDEIDAILVGTPDHTHAVAALPAMRRGIHVYVEKPLTHTLHEARLLTEAAREHGVVTQMGNQGSSGDGIRLITEWIEAGVIGEVRRAHAWTNRPVWPQGLLRPEETPPVPPELDWDLWLGPAPMRPYHPTYVPFSWRGWWDFGTGALGDMGCHILDPIHRALNLGYPTSVEASASVYYHKAWTPLPADESAPNSALIHYEFPGRDGRPPVHVTWYDGGIMPRRPEELQDDEMMGDWGGGCLFEGSEGKIMCGTYGRNPTLLPTSLMDTFEPPAPTIPRVPGGDDGHQRAWIEAIKGGAAPSSSFEHAGPLTEMVLMGNLALRSYFHTETHPNPETGRPVTSYPGRKKLLWDGAALRITNFEPANDFVRRSYRAGWTL